MTFDYFYGNEAEQFTFYRIPKVIVTSPEFRRVSDSAKLLYGLMLDRMGLSLKNSWVDEHNRAYIYFKIDEIMELMCCAAEKATRIVAELDSVKGIGLIERVKQGQGKPAKIYLKKFIASNDAEKHNSSISKIEKQDFSEAENQTFENQNSKLSIGESQDFRKPKCNYNNINNTELNNINPINQDKAVVDSASSETIYSERWIDRYNKIMAEIKEQIDYDYLIGNNERTLVDEVVNIMADVMTVYRPKYKIEGEYINSDTVIHRFRMVTAEQIEVFLIDFEKLRSTIHNPKSYIISALYNMPLTSHFALSNMVSTSMMCNKRNDLQGG